MSLGVVIVAAGRGQRAGGGVPKQFRLILGRPILAWTIEAFAPFAQEIILVHHPDDSAYIDAMTADPKIHRVLGAETRDGSVRAGLAALGAGCTQVLIHDAARPLVSAAVIEGVIAALANHPGAAPGVALADALWRADQGAVLAHQDRAGLVRAQTPQGFDLVQIRAAHAAHPGGAADDVEVARAYGLTVAITPGSEDNFKITTPEDFARAERVLRAQNQERKPMDIRVGNGFDVHRFGPGDHVILCGVRVPHGRGLQGHSDADVGMHTVSDAIYGALAEGDIGTHFPPSDPQWKGAASEIFLAHAVGRAAARGYRVGNVDCTLICEHPKIGPYALEMRAEMARIMGLDLGQISVKATTSERLGFTGREEGIACLATVTLIGEN